MKSKYTIGAMIGNAISTHILEVMQGICQAAKSMNANVLFFLGIHCGFYYKLNELEDIDKDFDQFLKMFTWNYLQKHFIKQDNLSVTKEEALAEAKSLAAAQFAQYGMPSAPEDMLAGYAEKILADKDQGQKIYEKLYEAKVVEDVKSKIKVTEKAVSAEDFAKLAQAL